MVELAVNKNGPLSCKIDVRPRLLSGDCRFPKYRRLAFSELKYLSNYFSNEVLVHVSSHYYCTIPIGNHVLYNFHLSVYLLTDAMFPVAKTHNIVLFLRFGMPSSSAARYTANILIWLPGSQKHQTISRIVFVLRYSNCIVIFINKLTYCFSNLHWWISLASQTSRVYLF
jgi:hypothetical protein